MIKWMIDYARRKEDRRSKESLYCRPYLDDMGCVTDPYQLWCNEFRAAGMDAR